MHSTDVPRSTVALTLFVNGASDLSALAIVNTKHICDRYLADRYQLRIVDVHDDLDVAVAHQVFVTPTLLRTGPPPERRVIGDLSHPEAVCRALDLSWVATPTSA